jgi:hypothetical protein
MGTPTVDRNVWAPSKDHRALILPEIPEIIVGEATQRYGNQPPLKRRRAATDSELPFPRRSLFRRAEYRRASFQPA